MTRVRTRPVHGARAAAVLVLRPQDWVRCLLTKIVLGSEHANEGHLLEAVAISFEVVTWEAL